MRNIVPPQIVHVALAGASGMQYSLSLVKHILAAGIDVSLYVSKSAKLVLALEMQINIKDLSQLHEYVAYDDTKQSKLKMYGIEDWTAPIASGSNIKGPIVVCPCSMGMLSAIAVGSSDNLIERACDVAIKENSQLILVPRETPFSAIHLENMLKLARLGVCILPANPGFYHQPKL